LLPAAACAFACSACAAVHLAVLSVSCIICLTHVCCACNLSTPFVLWLPSSVKHPQCLRSCTSGSAQWRLRPPGADLWGHHSASWHELGLMSTMLGSVLLHRCALNVEAGFRVWCGCFCGRALQLGWDQCCCTGALLGSLSVVLVLAGVLFFSLQPA
jgi:hypothetical protein